MHEPRSPSKCRAEGGREVRGKVREVIRGHPDVLHTLATRARGDAATDTRSDTPGPDLSC